MKRNPRQSETTPGDSTRAVHLWLVLWKATRAVEAHAHKSIASQPICPSDFAVLEVVLHKGPLPVNAIGRKVLLTSGSITVAVDRLEAQGFVERRAHPSDRRARVVHLTSEGKRLITRIFAEHERDMERAASTLTASERATLVRLLKKLGLYAERVLGETAEQEEAHDTRNRNAAARRSRRR
uniref:Transcriptional regulator n=1 Tax=uncultured bacterium F42-01 TaxID=1191438 RepID=I3VIL1_9BACT|nr:transcriptional regulator [uncultured bacterium F42-01]